MAAQALLILVPATLEMTQLLTSWIMSMTAACLNSPLVNSLVLKVSGPPTDKESKCTDLPRCRCQ
jgi:hypothetical protein